MNVRLLGKIVSVIMAALVLTAFFYLPWIGVYDMNKNIFMGVTGYVFTSVTNGSFTWALNSLPIASIVGILFIFRPFGRKTAIVQIVLSILGIWALIINLSQVDLKGYSTPLEFASIDQQIEYFKTAATIWSSGLSYGGWVACGGMAGLLIGGLLGLFKGSTPATEIKPEQVSQKEVETKTIL